MSPHSRSLTPGPRRVVDLFCGCGGLSLGFELLEGGEQFETVLAADVEAAMVRVFNANHHATGNSQGPAVQLDLTSLHGEAEVLAWYLDHLRVRRGDVGLERDLDEALPFRMKEFKGIVGRFDSEYRQDLESAIGDADIRSALRDLPPRTLSQSTVAAFHSMLGLPTLSTRKLALPPLAWTDHGDELSTPGAREPADCGELGGAVEQVHAADGYGLEWQRAVAWLKERADSSGGGSGRASHERIAAFVDLVEGPALRPIRSAWMRWRSRREAAVKLALPADSAAQLRAVYDRPDRRVDVLLGGPPCQGFSRVGRGKLRSLRESGIDRFADEEFGDIRNRLFLSYVLVLESLLPTMFLFENVSTFQSRVGSGDDSIEAPELLRDAIRDISQGSAAYTCHGYRLNAADFGVPQFRDRYFVAGLRDDSNTVEALNDVRHLLGAGSSERPVPLGAALEDLPEPVSYREVQAASSVANGSSPQGTAPQTDLSSHAPTAQLIRWLRAPRPGHLGGTGEAPGMTAHVIREPREDDRRFFRLMGEGRDWEHYRCDHSRLLAQLRRHVEGHPETGGSRQPSLFGEEPTQLRLELDEEEPDSSSIERVLDGSLAWELLVDSLRQQRPDWAVHRDEQGRLTGRELRPPGLDRGDYSCAGTPTLSLLRRTLPGSPEPIRGAERGTLLERLDGTLSLRLLLEATQDPDEEHHLLRPAYLAKGPNNHGDWLSRLDSRRVSRTILSHMAKDTYAYVHPWQPRTLSVREAARIQTFPDWFDLSPVGFSDGYRVIGNAVPPLLSHALAGRTLEFLRRVREPAGSDSPHGSD